MTNITFSPKKMPIFALLLVISYNYTVFSLLANISKFAKFQKFEPQTCHSN